MPRSVLLAGLIQALVFLIVGVVLYYLAAPVQVWRTLRARAIRTKPLAAEQLPQRVRSAVEIVAHTLGSAGFRLASVSEANEGAAVIIHAFCSATGEHFLDYITPAARWQVFLTRYPDGAEVVTSNCPAPSVFSAAADQHVCILPPETDVPRLHHAHQAHVRKAVGAQRAPTPATGAPNFVEDQEHHVLERQRRLGLYVRDGEVYRPTLRGAYLMTWRLLPPLKGMRAARNARALQELEPLLAPDRASLA